MSEPTYSLTRNNLQDIAAHQSTSQTQHGLVSRVARARGAHFCYITSFTPVSAATRSSIQTSKQHHAELTSALVYTNHSCAPTVELLIHSPDETGHYQDGIAGEFRVVNDRDLKVGDELTWFYPSTEWEFAEPFHCACGAGGGVCVGVHSGSATLPTTVLDKYFINDHVEELAAERDGLREA